MPKVSKTEEWTGRLVLVAFGVYVLVFVADVTAKLILGVPLTFGPLFESAEFRVVFKIVINRVSRKQVFQIHRAAMRRRRTSVSPLHRLLMTSGYSALNLRGPLSGKAAAMN